MKADIYSNKILIGTADLKIGDKSMGHIYGEFIPTQNYFELVQRTVWVFWQSGNNPDYQKWNGLGFMIRFENGFVLPPLFAITIDDVEELPDEPKRVDISLVDLDLIERFL